MLKKVILLLLIIIFITIIIQINNSDDDKKSQLQIGKEVHNVLPYYPYEDENLHYLDESGNVDKEYFILFHEEQFLVPSGAQFDYYKAVA